MSSASSDSWSRADVDALSITSSPMSTSSSLDDIPTMPAPEPAREDVNVNTPSSEPGTALSRQRSPMLDTVDDGSFKRSKYYMSEEDIFTVVVEDTVFKLHAFFFKRESARFRELLEAHPRNERLVLTGTKAEDLERFLDLLYPIEIGPESYVSKTADEWMSILRIAHRWDFRAIHKLAIQHLEPVASPVDKIVCARTVGAGDWLITSYTALCTRAEPLTLDEGMRLGVAALHERKDVLASEDILRVGMREITCINDAREEIAKSKKKDTKAFAALVEKKLEEHGLLQNVDERASGTSSESSVGASEAKPAQQKAKSASGVFVHEPIYQQPRLDIRDQSGQSVLGGDLDSDVDWLLYGSQEHFKLRRINNKLIIADHRCNDSTHGYFNGNKDCRHIYGSCTFLGRELKHGDVIAFSGDAAVSPLDGHIICLPDTGYIVCREDTPLGTGERPDAFLPQYCHSSSYDQRRREDLGRWASTIENDESKITSLEKVVGVTKLCMEQGRISGMEKKIDSTRQEVQGIIERLRDPVKKLMAVAQLQAETPLQTRRWMPKVSDRPSLV